jgi:hypothetical protein
MGLELPVTPPPPLTSFCGCRSRTSMCPFFIRRQADRTTLILRSLSCIPALAPNARLIKTYALRQDNFLRQFTQGLDNSDFSGWISITVMTFDSFKLKKRCEPFRRQQRWIIRRFRRLPCRLLRLPKRIGLRSHIRLSGVLVKNVLDYVTRRFNASSAGLKSRLGSLTFAEAPLSAISRFNWSPSQPE